MQSDSVVIIGGGVAGLLCAYSLQKDGIPVVVVEQQRTSKEASWAGAGILSPIYPMRYPDAIVKLTQWSLDIYPQLVDRIKAITKIDPELTRSGAIIVDPLPNAQESHSKIEKLWGKDFTYLPGSLLQKIEPELRAMQNEVLLLSWVSQIRSSRFVAALREAVADEGGAYQEGQAVGFEASGGVLTGIKLRQQTIPAERCIVAAGPWSGTLLEGTGITLPVRPIKGQMLLIAGPRGYLRHIIVKDYRYLVPRRDGRILVGSTVEDVGFDKSSTPQARRELLRAATDLVPGLARFPIEAQWAGLRPGSPDSLPFIGEHPHIKGLFVCTGHHRNGFAIGPAAAQIVVDLMARRTSRVDASLFQLDRPVSQIPTH